MTDQWSKHVAYVTTMWKKKNSCADVYYLALYFHINVKLSTQSNTALYI